MQHYMVFCQSKDDANHHTLHYIGQFETQSSADVYAQTEWPWVKSYHPVKVLESSEMTTWYRQFNTRKFNAEFA